MSAFWRVLYAVNVTSVIRASLGGDVLWAAGAVVMALACLLWAADADKRVTK